ncbi:MAG: hypothetical protein ACK5HM_11425, partial [Gemmatimonas sp.]|uniref:hypothetical protein n=1 Tax=Gemmatimonas sp. TaxID=1962908 RepID=UPI00391D17ED
MPATSSAPRRVPSGLVLATTAALSLPFPTLVPAQPAAVLRTSSRSVSASGADWADAAGALSEDGRWLVV